MFLAFLYLRVFVTRMASKDLNYCVFMAEEVNIKAYVPETKEKLHKVFRKLNLFGESRTPSENDIDAVSGNCAVVNRRNDNSLEPYSTINNHPTAFCGVGRSSVENLWRLLHRKARQGALLQRSPGNTAPRRLISPMSMPPGRCTLGCIHN